MGELLVVGGHGAGVAECAEILPGIKTEAGRDPERAAGAAVLERGAVRLRGVLDEVQTVVHYPIPIHLQKAYAELGYKAGAFPNAEKAAQSILSLPMFPEMTEAQVEEVAGALKRILA